ncbi:MAG TPA: hypothetical protein VLF09_10955 [Cellvibrio sp.]|nr:hypothetical protein [Cellvibrio sp.]
MFVQLMIVITGISAVWLSQDKHEHRRRFACLFGVAGQPFWLYESFCSEQWGIFALSIIYTFAWLRGVRHFWFNSNDEIQENESK